MTVTYVLLCMLVSFFERRVTSVPYYFKILQIITSLDITISVLYFTFWFKEE